MLLYRISNTLIATILAFALSGSTSLRATDFGLIAQNQADSDAQSAVKTDDGSAAADKWGQFLPLPIFVTEPAIGEGLGATLIYFHHEAEKQNPEVSTGRDIASTGESSKPPPTASGIFGFYTNNDTYAAGIGHSNSFAEDHYRLRVAAARTRVNSNIYLGDLPIGFQLEGDLLFADLKMRLGESGIFFGLSTSYVNADNQFQTGFAGVDNLLTFDFVDTGVAASLIYDTRDNTVLPGDGFQLELTGWNHDESIGSDFNYTTARLKALWFTGLGRNYVLGLRVDSSQAGGDVPFYAYPFVRLRGIPALRYQGEVASAFEVEGRRRIGERWTASLFAGAGSIRIDSEQVETDDEIRTIGIGTRYLAYRKQDAWVGVDVARGPEQVAVYIQVGSTW